MNLQPLMDTLSQLGQFVQGYYKMISYYIATVIGFIFGYFVACLMMMAKGNVSIDEKVHSWKNK